ncbi:hypothetical protein VaNZ11_013543 [Volvox africanus]|uniref:RecA family profile 1 domain-containing protein n=1 Tax=Volvox africanus TaxID=51714 RepID=A0ABQ5SHK6_9CHLO|nr:hypothetical protein VaNZ11_013543 [Volvox africanus]
MTCKHFQTLRESEMRWEDLSGVLPQGTLYNLACNYQSVEAFVVNRSKALSGTTGHGILKGCVGPMDVSSDVDAVDLAVIEPLLDSCLAPQWRSGAQLMHELRYSIQVLPTGCSAIDTLLGGGLREGTLVEIAGETCSGKTQLCLSATATTAYRGEAVMYVDTTGSFAPERVVQMAEAEAAASAGTWPQLQAPDAELATRILRCISVLRPSSVYDLLSSLDRLGAVLERQLQEQEQRQQHAGLQEVQGVGGCMSQSRDGQVEAGDVLHPHRMRPRLLVIDSVSALLSTVLGNNQHMQGTALLTAVGRILKQLAQQYSIAVLVTNHVTSANSLARGLGRGLKGAGSGGEGAAMDRCISTSATVGVGGLKPALGEQWRSQPHMRVQLSMDASQAPESRVRVATLTASPLQACGQKLEFRIAATGLL